MCNHALRPLELMYRRGLVSFRYLSVLRTMGLAREVDCLWPSEWPIVLICQDLENTLSLVSRTPKTYFNCFTLTVDLLPVHHLSSVPLSPPPSSTVLVLPLHFLPAPFLGSVNCFLTCLYPSASALQTQKLRLSTVLRQLYTDTCQRNHGTNFKLLCTLHQVFPSLSLASAILLPLL